MSERAAFRKWKLSWGCAGGHGSCDLFSPEPIPWPMSQKQWTATENSARAKVEERGGMPQNFTLYSATPIADDE